MANPEVGIALPKTDADRRGSSVPDIGAFGQRIEDWGYNSIWTTESWGDDAFVDLATIAAKTDEVRLGTAIVNIFSRRPGALAMAAATLDRRSDGRAILGLGTSHKAHVEKILDVPFERPLQRMAETIELVRQLIGDTESVDYVGEIFDVSGAPGLGQDVPIFSAALGERNRRIAGQLSDGWIPYNIPYSRLEAAYEHVADGARDEGRDPDEITVAPFVNAAVSEDVALAKDIVRECVASYVGRFTDDTHKSVVAAAHPEGAQRVADRWRDGDREGAAAAVTDEMVADLGVAGTPEDAREQLRDLMDNPVVDLPIVLVPRSTYEQVGETTFRELAPDRL